MTLAVDHVVKAFDGMTVLDDISLSVGGDKLTGLVGPNGAGKSTLFSIISGFELPDAGSVTFMSAPITRLTPEKRSALGIFRTFQVPRLFERLSVLDNLAVCVAPQTGERLHGLVFQGARVKKEEGQIRERAREVLARLKLAHAAETPAGQLSGGQKKLVELGRIMMASPKFVLLDEPFAGVNPVLIDEICQHIRALSADGVGCLVVEHNLTVLGGLVSELFVMDRGRLLAQGQPDEVLRRPEVELAYVGGSR